MVPRQWLSQRGAMHVTRAVNSSALARRLRLLPHETQFLPSLSKSLRRLTYLNGARTLFAHTQPRTHTNFQVVCWAMNSA